MKNMEVILMLNRYANLLEIDGANPFRIRAYRNAARMIGNLQYELAYLLNQDEDLQKLPGIGPDLAEKIRALVSTGHHQDLTNIEETLPPIIKDLLDVEGLGPKRIHLIYKELNIQTKEDLQLALTQGRLATMKGFGKTLANRILEKLAK